MIVSYHCLLRPTILSVKYDVRSLYAYNSDPEGRQTRRARSVHRNGHPLDDLFLNDMCSSRIYLRADAVNDAIFKYVELQKVFTYTKEM